MLALGQTDKTSTENSQKPKNPQSLNNLSYDNDNSIGWKIIPQASYKRLKSMYLMVHVVTPQARRHRGKWSNKGIYWRRQGR